MLCEQRFDWVPTHGANIPGDAVEGGRTSDGEPLYIGRVHHEGSNTVGKVTSGSLFRVESTFLQTLKHIKYTFFLLFRYIQATVFATSPLTVKS